MDFKFAENKNGSCRQCDSSDDVEEFMVSCDSCDRRFHIKCVGLARTPRSKDHWKCDKCLAIQEMLDKQDALIKSLEEKCMKYFGTQQVAQNSETNQNLQVKALEAIIDKINSINISQTSSNSLVMRQSLMDLPEFDGSYKIWPRFKQAFYETTRQGNFSDFENINRLNNCLKGEALSRVNSLLINSSNLNEIMIKLEDQFGSVERVYSGLLNDVLALRNPKFENPQSMIDFISGIGDLVINMECMKHPEYLNDQRLVRDLAKKLPASLHQKWLMSLNEEKMLATIKNPYIAPTLKTLYEWLKPQEKLASMLLAERGANKESSVETVDRVNYHGIHQLKCYLCDQNHKLTECDEFKKISLVERRKFVAEKKLCFSCCRANHLAKHCRFAEPCNTEGCKSKHNRLLHLKIPEKKIIVASKPTKDDLKKVNCHVRDSHQVYYPIIPVTLMNGENSFETFAFFDSGSSVSLIDKNVVNKLKVTGRDKPLTLAWTNGEIKENNRSKSVQLNVKGPNGKLFQLNDLRTIKGLSLPHQSVDIARLKARFSYLENSKLESYEKAVPTILLGLPHAFLFKGNQELSGRFNEPIARKTKLGWVLFGSSQIEDNKKEHVFIIREVQKEDFSKNLVSKDTNENCPKGGTIKVDQSSERKVLTKEIDNKLNVCNVQTKTFGAFSSQACVQVTKNKEVQIFIEDSSNLVEQNWNNQRNDYLVYFYNSKLATKVARYRVVMCRKANKEFGNSNSNLKLMKRNFPLKEMELYNTGNILCKFRKKTNCKLKNKVTANSEEINSLTKRQNLSHAMDVYDRQSISFKSLMKNLWKSKYSWDECIPEIIKLIPTNGFNQMIVNVNSNVNLIKIVSIDNLEQQAHDLETTNEVQMCKLIKQRV